MIAFPKDLIDAFNSDEVVCVVGSGPSIAAGFPSWLQLLELMVDECEKQLVGFKQGLELRALLKQGHFLEVADECSKLLSGQLLRDLFQRIFREGSISPTKLHRQLAQLPFSAILTTNYDNLLERVYVAKNRANSFPLVITQTNIAQLPRLASERRFFILKMHGDADDVQTLVLTKQDYRNIIHGNDLYRTALSQILATRTALFIGYGLRDHDLNLLLGEQAALFKAYGRRHYVLLPDPGTILPKSYLEHYNLTVIPYSGKGSHAELGKLVQSLVQQVKRTPADNERAGLQNLKQLMQVEREFCDKLKTHIEIERARFLKLHASEVLDDEDRKLIENSIRLGEQEKFERQKLEEQLRQSQKMEAIGQLAGGIAHDFNNILTIILDHAAILTTTKLEPDALASAQHIKQASERAAGLTRQLLAFSRRQVIQSRLVDLNEIVQNLLKMLTRLLGEDITFHPIFSSSPAVIEADIGMVEQVLLNLVVNARDAMPRGGDLRIEVQNVSVTDEHLLANPDSRIGTFVLLKVSDTGCGIPPEILPRLFEPFFTTKEVGKGTGLGLATVYGIIKQHQGWIEVESAIAHGTTFFIYFPIASQPRRAVEKPNLVSVSSGGGETILVVEDEQVVREGIVRLLERSGYRVLQASNGCHAMEVWHSNKDKIKLVFTDIVMPIMNGLELAEMLLTEDPRLKIIFNSGYDPGDKGKDYKVKPGFNFLAKPFDQQTLGSFVREVLDTGRLTTPSASLK